MVNWTLAGRVDNKFVLCQVKLDALDLTGRHPRWSNERHPGLIRLLPPGIGEFFDHKAGGRKVENKSSRGNQNPILSGTFPST